MTQYVVVKRFFYIGENANVPELLEEAEAFGFKMETALPNRAAAILAAEEFIGKTSAILAEEKNPDMTFMYGLLHIGVLKKIEDS